MSLFGGGRGLAFPCDAAGLVDMDAMSEFVRNNYLAARALIGREYAFPRVRDGQEPPSIADRVADSSSPGWRRRA